MSHVDDGTLHALVDDELAAAEREAVQGHLATCGDCARRFAEATAMARQVRDLLGALDEAPVPLRIQAPSAASRLIAPAPDVAELPRRRAPIVTLRRLAVAASLLVVAGVSYRMGGGGESSSAPTLNTAVAAPEVATAEAGADDAATQAPASVPSAPPSAPTSVRLSGTPSATRAVPPPTASAPVRSPLPAAGNVGRREVAAADRAAVPSTAAGASVAAERAEATVRAPAVAAAPAPSLAPATAAAAAPEVAAGGARAKATTLEGARKLVPLEGYTVVEEQSLPAIVRRRYLSSAGTPLVLIIVQGADADVVSQPRVASPEFTVRTTKGMTAVRWTRQGQSFELSGALPPDSLVKLATRLR